MSAFERSVATASLAESIAQLVDGMEHVETVEHRPSREHPAYADTAIPLPRTSEVRHISRAPGLLTQLDDVLRDPILTDRTRVPAAAAVPAMGQGEAPTGASGAESNPPPGARAGEVLADLVAGIVETARRARRISYLPTQAVPTGHVQVDAVAQARRALHLLMTCVLAVDQDGTPSLPDDLVVTINRYAGSWVRTARLELGWSIATIELPGVFCPDCGSGGSDHGLPLIPLRVLKDASSDVWCPSRHIGPGQPGENRRCGRTWPRHTWTQLLDQQSA